MHFPIYRKYSNGKSFFKIYDDRHFVELKWTGSKIETYEFDAKILPDLHFIQDMIAMKDNHWVESSESEFNAQTP